MHKVLFYPVGSGDTSQIILKNGRRILMDYRHLEKAETGKGPEINLKERLRTELKDAGKKTFDVVALTHGDDDHICGSTDFFELLHAKKYQGGDRIPIDELWVPAAMILEEGTRDGQTSEYIIWRQEARHRLREGKGIRVFSKPEKLKNWLEMEGLKLDSRRDLITDAGKLVPGFTLASDGVEFFCHSPFVKHVDGGDDLRNSCALVFNVRFKVEDTIIDYLAIGDSEWSVLEDIVETTQAHKNDDRLCWDLYNIPHHCSYRALSDAKGDTETEPKAKIKELLLKGRANGYLVSSSLPIPDSKDAREQAQPPHVQARKCYETYLRKVNGARFLVTMEESPANKPAPIVFVIDKYGVCRETVVTSPEVSIVSSRPPRAG